MSNATPYNWAGLYRQEKPSWGFCMSKKDLKKIKNKNFLVEIKTKTLKSKMRVLLSVGTRM